jgi:thiosulfate sulfurtransferase
MFKQLTHTEAERLMNEGEVIIADVRDQQSYDEAHIGKAIHLSMSALQEFCDSTDKSAPVLVYCYHGISSQSVANHLVDQGFSKVYSLIGGFETWKSHHPTSDASN